MYEKRCKRDFSVSLLLPVLCILSLSLISCPSRISEENVLQVKDEVGPVITILSPENESSYAATVIIEGQISDYSDASGSTGGVKACRYEVLAAGISNEILLSGDGSFTFQFPTANLSGPLVINITAEDWNGNTGVALLTLLDQGAIPTFEAEPGNGQVRLTWDPVPLAGSYTIYYEKADIIPTEEFSLQKPDAVSGTTITGLENGDMHVFLLRAHSTSGPDNWSDYVKAIPLSDANLAPRLIPEFKAINVEWNPVPATEEYEVYKSSSPDTGFRNISGVIRGSSFRDTSVVRGQQYYYAVKPAEYNPDLSGPTTAQCSAFSQPKEVQIAHLEDYYGMGGLAAVGDYLYFARGSLYIFDVSDPSNPVEVMQFSTSCSASGLAVSGTYAYVGGWGGVCIVDITDPLNPVEVGYCNIPNVSVRAVAVSGSRLYGAAWDDGMRIIDISNLQAPVEIGVFPATQYDVRGVAANGMIAYVCDWGSAFRVLNTTNPQSIVQIGEYTNGISGYYGEGVDYKNGYCYVATSDSFDVISVSGVPLRVGRHHIPSGARDVAVKGQYAYVAWGYSGLRVMDISNPSSPTEIFSYDTPGSTVNLAVTSGSEDYVYLGDANGGIRVLDLTKPDPQYEGSASISIQTHGVVAWGNYVYVAAQSQGVIAYDVSQPDYPQEKGSYTDTGGAQKIFASGGRLYKIGGCYFRVLDILTNPDQPSSMGYVNMCGDIVTVSGSYAYVGEDFYGLKIYDVSVPGSPFEVGNLEYGFSSNEDIEVVGNYVYLACSSNGLKIIDVSDPSAPVEVGSITSSSFSGGVRVRDSYAYIADGSAGLRIYDISDPKNPVFKGSYGSLGAYGLEIDGRYAYITVGVSGFWICDITDPTSPTYVDSYNPGGYVADVAVSGRFAYLVGDVGLLVLRLR